MRIALRIALLLGGFALAGFVLWRAFDDFDLGSVASTIGDLTWVDITKLAVAFGVSLCAEAFLGSAFVPGLSLRRGAISWLASNAVASVVPGPSDVPLRYRMFRSWGLDTSSAATASAGATLINVATKLVLPALAALGIWLADVDIGNVRNLIISACVACAVVVVAVGFAFGSEERTRVGARRVARLVRRPGAEAAIVRYRNEATVMLRQTWRKAALGSALVAAITVVIFVFSLRAVGIGPATASWLDLFCVWALVRGVTVIPTMPGDAGVSELAFVTLLTEVADGAGVNTITAGILLYRAITWIVPIPLGVAAIGVWRWELRRHGEPAPAPAERPTPVA